MLSFSYFYTNALFDLLRFVSSPSFRFAQSRGYVFQVAEFDAYLMSFHACLKPYETYMQVLFSNNKLPHFKGAQSSHIMLVNW